MWDIADVFVKLNHALSRFPLWQHDAQMVCRFGSLRVTNCPFLGVWDFNFCCIVIDLFSVFVLANAGKLQDLDILYLCFSCYFMLPTVYFLGIKISKLPFLGCPRLLFL